MLAEEHLEVQVREDVRQRHVAQHVALEIRRRRHRDPLEPPRRHRRRRGRRGLGTTGRARHQRRLLAAHALDQRLACRRREELVGEVEPVHRVLGVEREPAVLGGDPGRGELPGERGAPDEERHLDARDLEILCRHHHLLGRLHQEP